jgi:ATP-dependent RNA helicase SUPV3L1/SUV3
MNAPSRIAAVLGPTNTGKTHYAIERMLAHRTGVIGLPLRLLAREVYDRIVALRGPSVVALVTGEERIVPDRAAYWVCTVEAMPEGMGTDFLAVDEIQLCADPERGHVFTDRLLHWRGLHETLFLGSETMWGAIAALVPGVEFQKRPRFSTLTYTGAKKIGRMGERAAIVGFSVENVYAMAEFIRRTRGGAAVVMGALSPRTRNAQVAMYQAGEVDFLVATDAIGMGLNLDIAHVAFAGLSKFDGARMRELQPDELAQIAGRAGRHLTQGTFGVTGEARELDEEVVAAIENHQFRPVTRLKWRNSRLEFGSVGRLIQSLEMRTDNPWLTRVRESDDLAALKALAADAEVAARATDGRSVRLLWDVCRIPDFRGISAAEHAALLAAIYNHLHQRGHVPAPWFAEQVARLDRTEGDIDTLSRRLAFVRTWTYVAQRSGWVPDEDHWRAETRAVEDRLSDALHAALTARFVDRRTSTLARRLRQKEVLVAEVNDKGEVTVEGHLVGRLEGFRFRLDKAGSPDEAKTLRQAAEQALKPHLHLKADRFYNAPDTELDFTEQGGLMWGAEAVGRLVAGPDPLHPGALAFVDEEAGEDVAAKVARRLQHFIDRKVSAGMEALLAVQKDESLTGLAKGLAFRLVEGFGIIPRGEIAEDVKALDQEARAALRKLGVRFGQFTVFLPPLLKPAPTRLRLVLWGLAKGLPEFPAGPAAGHVTVAAGPGMPPGYWPMAGYRAAGERAVRIDMLERLADLLRAKDSKAGFEADPAMMSITGLGAEGFAALMQGLGYRAEKRERAKVKGPKPGSQGRASEPALQAGPEAVEPAPDPAVPAEPGALSPADVTGLEPALPVPVSPVAEALAEVGTGADAGDVSPAEPSVSLTDQPGDGLSDAPTPAESPSESPAGDAAAPGPVEMEVYYHFTWGGRASRGDRQGDPRGDGPGRRTGRTQNEGRGDRPRRPRAADAPGEAAVPAAPDATAGDRPRRDKPPRRREDGPRAEGETGKPRSFKGPRRDEGKGPRREGEKERVNKAQVFAAAPPREERPKRVDPDNPFAALAALKFK